MTGEDWPAATTRLVALLGDPVAHSLSPRLHNRVFRQLGLDLVYVALRTASADVPLVLDALGSVGAVGANVTFPHKLVAHDHCDHLSDEARLLGVVNTISWRDGRLHGTNTDATGLARVLATTVGDVERRVAVVLGTGGAARAAVVAATRVGARPVVVGRRAAGVDAVLGIARSAGASDARGLVLGEDDRDVADAVADADVVLNATPLGMAGERLPAPFHRLRRAQVAHDLVYGHGTTPFLADARAAGASAHDGRAMLAAQAADAFVVWTAQQPPQGAYEAALD